MQGRDTALVQPKRCGAEPSLHPHPIDASRSLLRRRFLSGIALATSGGWTLAQASPSPEEGDFSTAFGSWPRLVGAWRKGAGNYVGYWSLGAGVHGVETGFRGHQVLLDPSRPSQAIAIARRPGRRIARVDFEASSVIASREIEEGRTLNGHAVFSEDGATLYTSENDRKTGNGFIGLRHADTLAKYAEFSSYGVGPHGILRIDDTLLIANGGVQVIPDAGKGAPLRMDPSLTQIDLRDGQLIAQWRLKDPQLSIRHIARGRNGKVGVALQGAHFDLEERLAAPVLAIFDGRSLSVCESARSVALRGYAGDVAALEDGGREYFAVGCTHANQVAWWRSDGSWERAMAQPSACALGAMQNMLFAATEAGYATRVLPSTEWSSSDRSIDVEWENHLLVVPST
ncbi:MAG: DUF1513 domain-containing protein [Aquabacterium sp.]|nr:MAG: DUF1513 domain-containing protein [Aquabacterium sp.]